MFRAGPMANWSETGKHMDFRMPSSLKKIDAVTNKLKDAIKALQDLKKIRK